MSKVTVTINGLDSCISSIKSMRDGLRPNVSALLDTVADDTEKNLNAVYNAGQPATGTWNGQAMTVESFNGLAQAKKNSISDTEKEVVASGESVLFFEYGAGDLTLHENGHYPGEYSETHQRQYVENKEKTGQGFWRVGNFTLTGVAPLRPVYYAIDVAKYYIRRHIKEVFR